MGKINSPALLPGRVCPSAVLRWAVWVSPMSSAQSAAGRSSACRPEGRSHGVCRGPGESGPGRPFPAAPGGADPGCPSLCPLRSFLLCDIAVPRWMRILPWTEFCPGRAARGPLGAADLPWAFCGDTSCPFEAQVRLGPPSQHGVGVGELGADLATLWGPLPSGGICAQLIHPNLTTPNLASGGAPRRSS